MKNQKVKTKSKPVEKEVEAFYYSQTGLCGNHEITNKFRQRCKEKGVRISTTLVDILYNALEFEKINKIFPQKN